MTFTLENLAVYVGVPWQCLMASLLSLAFFKFSQSRHLHPLNKLSYPGVCFLFIACFSFNCFHGLVWSSFGGKPPCVFSAYTRTIGFSGVLLFTLAICTALLGRYECAYTVRLLRSNPKEPLPFFMRHSAYIFTYRLVVVTLSLWLLWGVIWAVLVSNVPHKTSSCDIDTIYPWILTLAEVTVLLGALYASFLWIRLRRYSDGTDELTFIAQLRALSAIGVAVAVLRLFLRSVVSKNSTSFFFVVQLLDSLPATLVFLILTVSPLMVHRRFQKLHSSRILSHVDVEAVKSSLATILCTPEGINAFTKFLSSEFHSEHLLFFQHCDEFKHLLDPKYLGSLGFFLLFFW